MKKHIVIEIIALFTLITGCNKIKQIANINVDIPYAAQFSLPAIAADTAGFVLPSGGISLPFPAIPVATNSKQFISQYNTAANMILDVYLKGLSLQLAAPANQNFDFLDSVQVFISAPNQPEVLVANEYNIPKGQSLLNLTTNIDVNLKNYFVQDTIYFRLQAHINAIPASTTVLNLQSVFHVLANPLD